MHEQSRSDRDHYVTIHWDNIKEHKKDQFDKCAHCDNQVTPYDYKSVMHYSSKTFNNGKGLAMTTKTGGYIGYKRIGFSDYDIIGINKLYSCGCKYMLSFLMYTK